MIWLALLACLLGSPGWAAFFVILYLLARAP
jgi:hypothetical protein